MQCGVSSVAKKVSYLKLSQEEIDAIKDIIADFEDEDRSVRDRQIRTWKKYDLLWNGFHQVWWDSVAHDWRIYGYNGSSSDNQAEYYDKNINVFRAFIETIIAALSNTIPPIKCLPDDADNINDVLTAKSGTRIGELVYNHIDAPLLWVRALWVYHLQGMVAAYNYTDEDKSYGQVELRETEDTEVDVEQSVCPSCGMMFSEKESEAIEDLEDDEYDPGDDDIILSDLQNGSAVLCPSCQIMVDPELRRDKMVVTRLTGVTHQAKARQCIEVNGGLFVKVPNYARNQSECPYVGYCFETHYTNVIEKYPDLRECLGNEDNSPLSSADGNAIYERWGRLNPQYRGEIPLNTPTERHWWLRASAFNSLTDDKLRKKLQKKFPDGCYAIMVNELWVGACNENLDDHWTLSFNPLSNYVSYDAPASLVTAIQEITSTLMSLEMQCIEHSIPQTFFNPKFLSSEQYRNSEVMPGGMFPTKTVGENRNISDGFHTIQTATVSPELNPFGAKVQNLGEFVSGAQPQIFGGSSGASSRTASQYAMQKNGAQQRLSNLTGRTFNLWWKNVFAKVIPAYMKYMLEDERLVKEDGKDNFINVVIKKNQTEGKIGNIMLQASEGLALSVDQVRDTIMTLIGTNNPEILGALFSPANLPVTSELFNLPKFEVPGELDREKQIEEITILMNTAPVMGDPMTGQEMPSVMPEFFVDNHQVEAEVCREFLVGEKGRQLKEENPEGYKNVLLHLQIHIQMLQQLSGGQGGQPPQAQQPESNPKELSPGN